MQKKTQWLAAVRRGRQPTNLNINHYERKKCLWGKRNLRSKVLKSKGRKHVKSYMGKLWIENQLVDGGYLAKISGNEAKVLLAITRHYNRHGTCFPSIRRLSVLVGLHPDTVSHCLRKLVEHDYFEQLVIKERCKLRYSFTKTARFLLIDANKLPEKPGGKEDIFKEVVEEAFSPTKNRTPEQDERIRRTLERIRNKKNLLLAKKSMDREIEA